MCGGLGVAGLFTMGGRRTGGWVSPILKDQPSSDPINQCVCVRVCARGEAGERRYVLLTPKGQKVGVCVPESWKKQAQLEEQRERQGRSSRGGTLDPPQTGEWTAPHGQRVGMGRGVIQSLPKGWWGVYLVRVSPASVEWPRPPSLALKSIRGKDPRGYQGQEPCRGWGDRGSRGGRSRYWKHLWTVTTHTTPLPQTPAPLPPLPTPPAPTPFARS